MNVQAIIPTKITERPMARETYPEYCEPPTLNVKGTSLQRPGSHFVEAYILNTASDLEGESYSLYLKEKRCRLKRVKKMKMLTPLISQNMSAQELLLRFSI